VAEEDFGFLSAAETAAITWFMFLAFLEGGRDGGVGGIEARRWCASYWDRLE
jgi:hypothetical protein